MSDAQPVPDADLSAEFAPADIDVLRRQVAGLQAQLQQRDDLLALAAHELRNPLHGLTLQIALAQATAEGEGATQTAVRIQKAKRMLARYADRATLLLELVSLDASAYPLSRKPVDLTEALRGVLEAVSAEARAVSIELRSDLPDRCMVETDAVVVGQMVDNLLLNACKHSGARVVTLTLRADAGWVRIDVCDDGRGIAADDRVRIFDKFGVASVGARGGGSGLGLWIVRRLAVALGGRVEVESAPAQGSVFTLAFPSSLEPSELRT